jgi:hypothetical protein
MPRGATILKAECMKPPFFVCRKKGGYDKDHFQCLPCCYNSVAPYKKDLGGQRNESRIAKETVREIPEDF